ncbi:HEAT repeat domain-containing protein [candidate division KSB1 bacterium]|nr:HEAT repeat domain-containing protein [candidate division KSB1 bacterium]
MKVPILFFCCLSAFLASAFGATGTEIIKYQGESATLSARWLWAVTVARQKNNSENFWIGYTFTRLMNEKSTIGSSYSDDGMPTLRQMIDSGRTPDSARKSTVSSQTYCSGSDEQSPVKIIKDIAILFRCSLSEGKQIQMSDIALSDMCLQFDPENAPMIWLGCAEDAPSIELLRGFYGDYRDIGLKEELITAIALHQEKRLVGELLKNVLNSRDEDELREKAAFWLGQQEHDEALKILRETAQNDRSGEVREQAVFGIYCMKSKSAIDALIDLARRARDIDVRRKAIFWLGQKASKHADEILEEIAVNDEETELQKQAVFALSQLPSGKGVPGLIRVAKTHPNVKIRKKAIFWLGQCDDDRALDALIEFVKDE